MAKKLPKKRLRIFFDDVPEPIRRAINILSASTGKRREELLEDMVRRCAPEAVQMAEQAIEIDREGER